MEETCADLCRSLSKNAGGRGIHRFDRRTVGRVLRPVDVGPRRTVDHRVLPREAAQRRLPQLLRGGRQIQRLPGEWRASESDEFPSYLSGRAGDRNATSQ